MPAPIFLSINEFPGDGVTEQWEFNFSGGYISREHVKALVQDEFGAPTDIEITDDMFVTAFTLDLGFAVPAGHTLRIYRDTPRETPLVDFIGGSNLTPANLDLLARQAIFVAAEAFDAGAYVEAFDLLGQAQTAASQTAAALAEALESQTQSAASAASAAASASNASTQRALAEVAAVAAAASASDAATARDSSLASANSAAASASSANTARGIAESSATAASASATEAAGSATSAAGSATAASSSAAAAAGSATSAAGSATAAASSASAAAASQAAAAVSAAEAAAAVSISGEVRWFAMTSAPAGFLKANGALVSRTTYSALFATIGTTFGVGDGSTTFALPDLRGEFIRGWDDGRGVDSGRGLGTAQTDLLRNHTHNTLVDRRNAGSGTTSKAVPTDGGTLAAQQNYATSDPLSGLGGAETRPRNIALLACIRV